MRRVLKFSKKAYIILAITAFFNLAAIVSDQLVIQKEDQIRNINLIIDSLPNRCKQIFLMSKIEGLKYKEISHNLRISVKTVEVQISKALKILRSKLVTFLLFLPDYIYDILNF